MIAVHAQPGAKPSEVAGLHGDAIKIRIAAPPVDGKANEAIVAFLAEHFDVPKSRVSVERGIASRVKQVRICTSSRDPETLINNPAPVRKSS